MICYARSGGTILNRCLGSMENVVMLSEVNPVGGGWGEQMEKSFDTPIKQAHQWYNITLESKDFKSSIIELSEKVRLMGKQLIVRDWPFVNFSPHPYNNLVPIKKLLTYQSLQNDLNLKPFIFIRNIVDIWISRGRPQLDIFLSNYNDYIDAVLELNAPIFKYEDFVEDPEKILKAICASSNITYSSNWHQYKKFTKVNGDTQKYGNDKELFNAEIRPPISKATLSDLDQMASYGIIDIINRKTGY